jgi:hypothetical protein
MDERLKAFEYCRNNKYKIRNTDKRIKDKVLFVIKADKELDE